MSWFGKVLGAFGAVAVAGAATLAVVVIGGKAVVDEVKESTPESRQKLGESIGRGAYGAAAGTVDVLKGAGQGAIDEATKRNPELARQAEEAAKRAGQVAKEFDFPLLKHDSAPFVTPAPAAGSAAAQQEQQKQLRNYVCSFKDANVKVEIARSLGMAKVPSTEECDKAALEPQ